MLGALIRKYWPGLYTTEPDGEQKLAYRWADYEVAPCPGFESAADAVITGFWVRHIFRVPFIVYDPTVLTHDSHNFYAWLKRHFRVTDEHSEATVRTTLHAHCTRLTRQQFYNQKHTSANQFTYEKTGKRAKKAENVLTTQKMTKEDFMAVSKLSMKFYIAAKLPLHYISLLQLQFQVMPDWADGREDAWEALVTRWVGGDAEFDAVSKRNKINRGSEGTHSAGSRNHHMVKQKLVCIHGTTRIYFPLMFLLGTHNISFRDAGRRDGGGKQSP